MKLNTICLTLHRKMKKNKFQKTFWTFEDLNVYKPKTSFFEALFQLCLKCRVTVFITGLGKPKFFWKSLFYVLVHKEDRI